MRIVSILLVMLCVLYTGNLTGQRLHPSRHKVFVPTVLLSQGVYTTLEPGIGYGTYVYGGVFREERVHAAYVSCEFNFNRNHFILAPKITCLYTGALVNGGIGMLYATDFDLGTVYLRPMVGFDIYPEFSVSFAYNIPVMRNHLKGSVNTAMLTLGYRFIPY
jgi:hypothetical protein